MSIARLKTDSSKPMVEEKIGVMSVDEELAATEEAKPSESIDRHNIKIYYEKDAESKTNLPFIKVNIDDQLKWVVSANDFVLSIINMPKSEVSIRLGRLKINKSHRFKFDSGQTQISLTADDAFQLLNAIIKKPKTPIIAKNAVELCKQLFVRNGKASADSKTDDPAMIIAKYENKWAPIVEEKAGNEIFLPHPLADIAKKSKPKKSNSKGETKFHVIQFLFKETSYTSERQMILKFQKEIINRQSTLVVIATQFNRCVYPRGRTDLKEIIKAVGIAPHMSINLETNRMSYMFTAGDAYKRLEYLFTQRFYCDPKLRKLIIANAVEVLKQLFERRSDVSADKEGEFAGEIIKKYLPKWAAAVENKQLNNVIIGGSVVPLVSELKVNLAKDSDGDAKMDDASEVPTKALPNSQPPLASLPLKVEVLDSHEVRPSLGEHMEVESINPSSDDHVTKKSKKRKREVLAATNVNAVASAVPPSLVTSSLNILESFSTTLNTPGSIDLAMLEAKRKDSDQQNKQSLPSLSLLPLASQLSAQMPLSPMRASGSVGLEIKAPHVSSSSASLGQLFSYTPIVPSKELAVNVFDHIDVDSEMKANPASHVSDFLPKDVIPPVQKEGDVMSVDEESTSTEEVSPSRSMHSHRIKINYEKASESKANLAFIKVNIDDQLKWVVSANDFVLSIINIKKSQVSIRLERLNINKSHHFKFDSTQKQISLTAVDAFQFLNAIIEKYEMHLMAKNAAELCKQLFVRNDKASADSKTDNPAMIIAKYEKKWAPIVEEKAGNEIFLPHLPADIARKSTPKGSKKKKQSDDKDSAPALKESIASPKRCSLVARASELKVNVPKDTDADAKMDGIMSMDEKSIKSNRIKIAYADESKLDISLAFIEVEIDGQLQWVVAAQEFMLSIIDAGYKAISSLLKRWNINTSHHYKFGIAESEHKKANHKRISLTAVDAFQCLSRIIDEYSGEMAAKNAAILCQKLFVRRVNVSANSQDDEPKVIIAKYDSKWAPIVETINENKISLSCAPNKVIEKKGQQTSRATAQLSTQMPFPVASASVSSPEIKTVSSSTNPSEELKMGAASYDDIDPGIGNLMEYEPTESFGFSAVEDKDGLGGLEVADDEDDSTKALQASLLPSLPTPRSNGLRFFSSIHTEDMDKKESPALNGDDFSSMAKQSTSMEHDGLGINGFEFGTFESSSSSTYPRFFPSIEDEIESDDAIDSLSLDLEPTAKRQRTS